LHCDPAVAAGALDVAAPLALADHQALAHSPELCSGFTHVFVLDPPPSQEASELLACSTAGHGAFLHLGWGEGEIDFAARVLEHQHGLRPHLTDVYRALKSLHAGSSAVPPAALEGEGRHPRCWLLAARCMRVLAELDLARFQRSSGTVSCTITNGKRADLESSETFRACAAAAQEGLRYLETLTSRPRTMKAA
jgi:hypothetical protein